MKRFLFMASIVGSMVFTACSSDEDIATTGNKIEVSGEQFTFTVEDFGADEGVTRATAAALPKPQTVDLGNGLEAEVSIEQDARTPQTRATKPISDGHYTIYAVDNATGTRVTGANSKVSGTVSGGKFTKDAGTKLELTPGTYTFVCFNDAVTDNGTSLTVNNGTDALIGTKTETISGTGWRVNFTMKHQTARIRLNIVSYTNEGTGITATLTSGSTYTTAQDYSTDASSATATTTATLSAAQTVPASGTVTNSAIVQTYKNAADYSYLLPGAPMSDLTFTIDAGTIYGKSLAGKAFPLAGSSKTLTRGSSYTINVKLKTFPYYLFDDGTVGAIGDKGSRTPIGLVINEKTATTEGMAIALKDAGSGLVWGPDNVKANDVQIPEYDAAGDYNAPFFNDMNGYHYTWEASGSDDGVTIKGNSATWPVFYAAGNYNPGITVTGANVGKWYLPAIGEWRRFWEFIDKNSWPSAPYDRSMPLNTYNGSNIYFTQAGGDAISYEEAASTETTGLTEATQAWYFGSSVALSDYFERNRGSVSSEWHVRAFVHF